MENKTDNRFGTPTEFTLTPENNRIRVKFFEKNISNELQSDYTLPDYLPEIRKILGIYPKISPISRYIGNSIEFSGRVDYDLIYCDADGQLTSVPLGEDFSFDVNPDVPANIDWNSSGEAYADVTADTVHVRATAPRKVSVKCRLHALVRAYGHDDTAADLGGSGNAEMLQANAECAELYRSMSEVIELSDEINVGSTAEQRYISTGGSVNVTDVTHSENRLNCRGEVITETLIENKETGEISNITKRIPFSQEIELQGDIGDKQAYHCVRGKCNDIKLSDAEDKYLIDTEVILEADTAVTRQTALTTDIFVPGRECTAAYRDFKYESLLKSGSSNISLSEIIPLSELSLSGNSEMIYNNGTVRIDGVTQNENGNALGGSIKVKMISKCNGEYASGETVIPFTVDLGTELGNKKISLYSYPMINDLRIKNDSEKVTVEADISLSYLLMREESMRIADSVLVDSTIAEKSPGITVYYPENGETLWNIAKKFGTSISKIAEMNDLPSQNGNDTVSGKRFLMIY